LDSQPVLGIDSFASSFAFSDDDFNSRTCSRIDRRSIDDRSEEYCQIVSIYELAMLSN